MLGPGATLRPAQDSPRKVENAAGDTRPSRGHGVARNNGVAHQSTVPVETPAGHLGPWSVPPSRGHGASSSRALGHPSGRLLEPGWGSRRWGRGQPLREAHTHISTRTSSGRLKSTPRKQRRSSQPWERARAEPRSPLRLTAGPRAGGWLPRWARTPTAGSCPPQGSAQERDLVGWGSNGTRGS